MNGIETFLSLYGLPAMFIVLLVKSIGVPIPIPADVIMLAASARVVEGKLVLWQAFVIMLAAILLGDVIQYALMRGPGRRFLYRFGRYLGLTAARLDAATSIVRKRGPIGLSIIILTPGVRAASVVACGLASVPWRTFTIGLVLGEGVFLALHFFLGSLIEPLLSFFTHLTSLSVAVMAIVTLLLIGLLIWFLIRRRQRPNAPRREVIAEAIEAWHEATCPVCLILGSANRLQPVSAEAKP